MLMKYKDIVLKIIAMFFCMTSLVFGNVAVSAEKPNILVIMGDDIGIPNLSAYSRGLMGYQTPNIDRIAKEGMLFTDYYSENSCTAGRASFITGQTTLRTGLSRVGLTGAEIGLHPSNVTIATLLKEEGYMTGQFGKNHLGDRNEHLPTVHGFDEFIGNLYHLNTHEEEEAEDYPKDPEFHKRFGPRGVLSTRASNKDDPTVDPRFGKVGKQIIVDTGPLTSKRMPTVDDEFLEASVDFMKRAQKADKPFFVWFASSRMHMFTHVPNEWKGKSGLNFYADGMLQHDDHVGQLLDTLDEMGIADNTIVIYTGDNGPHSASWPDAGVTWFRSEKVTNWEGAFRVPLLVRWPGKIPADTVSNEIMAHLDWAPTLLAAAGKKDIKEELKKGYTANGKEYKNHLDGYNFIPHLTGKEEDGPRREFFYFNDDAQLTGLRYNRWKMVFMKKEAEGQDVWRHMWHELRAPLIFDLRMDPFEEAEHSNTYEDFWMRHTFLLVPSQPFVGNFLKTFQEFPPSQAPASFNLDAVMKMMLEGGGSR